MAIPRISNYSILHPNGDVDNKTHWALDSSRAVLLIHDMQKYFVDFYDVNEEPIKSVIDNIKSLKQQCKRLGIPVVYTAQPPKQTVEDRALLTDFWGTGLKGEGGEEQIIQELTPEAEDTCLTKWRYSAFQRTPLQSLMNEQNRDQLIICGVYAHIGILATSLDAFMNDIKAFVVSDAVADFSCEDHAMALDYISQRCGQVIGLSDIQALSLKKQTLSLDQMKKDVAKSLLIPASDIDDQDNLLDFGLDSIRLMALLEKWRSAGADISFADLAEASTLAQWWDIIYETLDSAGVSASESELLHG